jgi:threonine dehydratase
MLPHPWLEKASERITQHIRTTPLGYDAKLDLYLKWENHQVTGSFKIRGALNKVLTLETWERQRGLVTASAGNHGQGVALAGRLVGAPVTVFCSAQAIRAKIEAMRALGAQVRLVSGGYGEAEKAGLNYAAASGSTWVSPYNDGQVIAGQGSLGLELAGQLPDQPTAAWVVPAGGGGLVAGIGAALQLLYGEREAAPPSMERPRLFAVQSEASPFFHAIFLHGSQQGIVELPSLADGLAGPVEEGSLTIPLVRQYTDDFILVSEAEIEQAIRFAWQRYEEVIEGSAAAALAAVLSGKISYRPAVVVITGGNIQPEVHAQIVRRR